MKKLNKRHLVSFCAPFLLITIIAADCVAAVPFESIKIGDQYYINTLFIKDNLVTVKQISKHRKKIKVDNFMGDSFYVHPKSLHRIPMARTSARGDMVGITAVNGEEWTVFDSKWYRIPGVRDNFTPIDAAASPASHISAVSLAPVIDGSWQDGGEEWRDWAESQLGTMVNKSEFIERARIKRIPFYSTPKHHVTLVEATVNNRQGTYYFIHVAPENSAILLDGHGENFFEINKALSFFIGSPQKALAYLKFFTSSIHEGENSFLILDPADQLLPRQAVSDIVITPLRQCGCISAGWKIQADVLFMDRIFQCKFKVRTNGDVSVAVCSLKDKISIESLVVVENARHFYIDHQP